LRALVARALVNKGLTLGILDRNEEEIAVCDEVLSRFGNAQEPLLREQAAKALFIKGSAFETQGNKKSAIDSYEEALALYGDDKGAKIEELVSRTRNSLDNLLSEGEASA
jgi:tetratricopeptide (TPR) repeat protein